MVIEVNVKLLEGLEVSGVCFIRDYVEFHFDGPVFRALSSPILYSNKGLICLGDRGYRDGLCDLIGETIIDAEDKGNEIAISFAKKRRLSVPKESTDAGPEIAHLVPVDPSGEILYSEMLIWENKLPTQRT